jgi:hypothetical protein
MAQCKALTNDREPCQIPARQGQKYCHIHRSQRMRRRILSGLAVGGVSLGILSFIANVTGILGYFGINLQAIDTPVLSPEEQKENGAYVRIESISPLTDTAFPVEVETPVVVSVTYYLPGNAVQPKIQLEYLQAWVPNGSRWHVVQELPVKIATHTVQLAGTITPPDPLELKDLQFQIAVRLVVLDDNLGRQNTIASDEIPFELEYSK